MMVHAFVGAFFTISGFTISGFTMLDGMIGRMVAAQPWRSGVMMVAEAALRSAVMGGVVYGVLQMLRVRQVRAQRYAWVLALMAALAMPALVKLPQPAFRLPLTKRLSMAPAAAAQSIPALVGRSVRHASPGRPEFRLVSPATKTAVKALSQFHTASHAEPSMHIFSARQRSLLARPARGWMLQGGGMAAMIYLSVVGVLLMRLALGVALTWQVRKQSVRAPFSRQEDIRLSARMKTPVTIGSAIVLPEDALRWDAERLRVVLAHERAHVRQGDSYLMLLAHVHCALFWFSPFTWWLQRRLSALGEAMADLAAVEAAESRATYAQVLLEFASAGHQPAGAVAMARASNLRPRIERLLNDRLFRESVGQRKRLAYVVAGIVPLAMLASASLVRLHAAAVVRSSQAGMAAGAKAVVATPPAHAAVMAPASASYQATRIAAASTALAMAVKDALVRENLQVSGGAPATSAPEAASPAANAMPTPSGAPSAASSGASTTVMMEDSKDGSHETGWSWNGDSTTLVTGDDHVNFGGAYTERYREIRRKVQGDFFLYQHDGKDYVIQDKAFLDKVRALYLPMQELGKQQQALGRQQELLGQQQETLGQQQTAVRVPTPDMSKELAELAAATAKLTALQSAKTIDREALADLQERMGEIQGRLGELQGRAGEQQGKLGEEQGRLGEQQGRLGEQQGKLGKRQGELGRQAQQTLKPMLEEALRNGTARVVD